VIPIPLGEDYLVVRLSLPFVYVPRLNQPEGGTYGLGDVRMQVFFAPKPGRGLIWGVGPALLFPTASDRTLGFGQWGIGPAFAAVWVSGRWTIGGRLENYWSFAGDTTQLNNSQLVVQPFVLYTLDDDWYLVSAPLIVALWNLPGSNWVVPVGGGFGKVVQLGNFPLNLSLQGYWQPIRPDNAEGWSLVVQLQTSFSR
jgi:hypothetical protein